MKPELQLHPKDSKFHGWATAVTVTDSPMQLKAEYVEALLSLPKFVNMDIVELYRMAEEKLTYTKRSGLRSGKVVTGITVTDRAFAIAIIVGCSSLGDPMLQMPTSISFGDEKISV